MNSRWFYILLANVAVLTANIWLFADKPTLAPQADKNTVSPSPTLKPLKKEGSRISSIESFHFPFNDPLASVNEDLQPQLDASYNLIKQKDREIKKVQQGRSAQAEKIALLEDKNRKLQQQLLLLGMTLEKNEALVFTQKKEIKTLQKGQSKNAFQTDIELVKKSIDKQPNLIKAKPVVIEPLEGPETEKQVFIHDMGAAEEVSEDEVIVDKFTGSIEFGFIYEQDNHVTKAVKGRLILDYDEIDRYNFNSDLDFEFEQEDGEMSTDKYRWQLQADYNLTRSNLVFARSDINRSQFSSYEQEDIFTVGYGHIFFNTERHKFNVEVGPGYRFAIPNAGESAVSADELIVRTRLNYERIVNENLQVTADTVLEIGHENSVYSLNLKAQNRIYQELYLVFDFAYKYTENVPVDTVNTEITSGLSLLYAF